MAKVKVGETRMTDDLTIFTSADLRAWRAREQLTQVELGHMFRVSQRQISLWERDDTHLPLNFTMRFQAVLNDYYGERK